MRPTLADPDAVEKPPELGRRPVIPDRRLPGADLREDPNPVGSRRRCDDGSRSDAQYLQEISSGHAATLPA